MYELNANIEKRDPFTMALRRVAGGLDLLPAERQVLAAKDARWAKVTKAGALRELARMGRTKLA